MNREQIQEDTSGKPYAFIMMPFEDRFRDTFEAYKAVLKGGMFMNRWYKGKKLNGRKLSAIRADERPFVGDGRCKIDYMCFYSDLGIAELGGLNDNVLTEVGMMWGYGKPVILTLNTGTSQVTDMPFDWRGPIFITYANLDSLADKLDRALDTAIRSLT